MRVQDPIVRTQVERRLTTLRKVMDIAKVRPSWLAYMRQALGMSQRDLAKIAKVSHSVVAAAERREENGAITLATLGKLARAMDCELVYAIVPRQTLEDILYSRCLQKAEAILRTADVHMSLEDQRVTVDFGVRAACLARKLMAEGDAW